MNEIFDEVEDILVDLNLSNIFTCRFYGNVYGKLCFGYEESDQHEEAEKVGLIAIEHTPNDIWAIHSLAHVYEETLKCRKGISFLEDKADNWRPRASLVSHMWWHNALFHVQLGEFEQALTLFDNVISENIKKGAIMTRPMHH